MSKYILIFLISLLFIACAEENNAPIASGGSSDANVSLYDEPYFYQQWALYEDSDFYRAYRIDSDAHIHAETLLDDYGGRGVKIAVIDEGLDVAHEDLSGAIEATFDLASGGVDVSPSDSISYHGTAVTGIVAARANGMGIGGVASESRVLFLKYKTFMTDSEVIELFDQAAAFGADIINNSWGSGNVSPAVSAKITDLAINGRDGKGICIVFSAGNDVSDNSNDESSIPEVISVGATNKFNERASYSNYGENLDIVAPGGEYLGISTLDVTGVDGGASIQSDYLLYNDSNGFVGTSASAPIVSGIIALMLEKNPNLTRVAIENILKESADKIGNVLYDTNGHNDYYGYGKVNLSSAMNQI